jgi:hypothetical protein
LKRYLTLAGAWAVLFPINLVFTTLTIGLQYIVAIFHMPVDLWCELDEELNQIHIEDE